MRVYEGNLFATRVRQETRSLSRMFLSTCILEMPGFGRGFAQKKSILKFSGLHAAAATGDRIAAAHFFFLTSNSIHASDISEFTSNNFSGRVTRKLQPVTQLAGFACFPSSSLAFIYKEAPRLESRQHRVIATFHIFFSRPERTS